MSYRGSFGGSQGKVAVGILGGAVALLWASTYVEVRDIKKIEGNVKVHEEQKRPEHVSPEAEAVVAQSRPAADSKSNKSQPYVAEYK